MTRRAIFLAFAAALPVFAPAYGQAPRASAENVRGKAGIIRLDVDASDAPQRIIHVKLHVPASAPGIPDHGGPLTLLYPEWIPGEHGPTGPIADLVSLKMSARGEPVAWRRDPKNVYAFLVNLPAGAEGLDVAFDFLSPPDAGGFSSGSSMTSELAVLSWNQFVLYPQGVRPDLIRIQPKLRLPKGWRHGTALAEQKESGNEIEFRAVALTRLIDSPVAAGAHFRTFELDSYPAGPGASASSLSSGEAPRHYLHVIADSDRALELRTDTVEGYKRLVREAGALFGSQHYREYHFLLTLSDHVAAFGLEHHESSDDRMAERSMIDDNLRALNATLLPHEFVHSWNGKYRRPSGLITDNYNQQIDSDLLWIYEGLTEYYSQVLAARAGLITPEQFKDWASQTAAELEQESGRRWRPLRDTSVMAHYLFNARDDYAGLRRGTDFYGEGALIWMEVDTLIRKETGGKKSLDDFCRAFYGGSGGEPGVVPYQLTDVISTLKSVAPHDWASFFEQRVETVAPHAPLGGIAAAGWKLTFDSRRSEGWNASEDDRKVVDLTYSLGLVARTDGGVRDVEIGGPAQKAGIAPGGTITQVNGRAFSPSVLRDAVEAAAMNSGDPIELVVKNGEYFSTHLIDYHGGERYPHLERDKSKPDMLLEILKPRSK